jgi:hypothetical protein
MDQPWTQRYIYILLVGSLVCFGSAVDPKPDLVFV